MFISGWLAVLSLLGGCTNPPVREVPRPSLPLPVRHIAPGRPPLPVITIPKANPVILVAATSSAMTEADRAYSDKIAARIFSWLRESGIPAITITDDQLAKGAGTGAKVVILPCNPRPGAQELQACRQLIAGGGRLIVFNSAEPRLATLMGFKLGAPKEVRGTGSWSGFRFTDQAPVGTPSRVEQESRNIRPVYPDSKTSRVIAWWEAPSKNDPREPAWVQSEHGFWMSQVLQESDVAAKQRLLMSLVSACDRGLWQCIAAHAVNQAGTLDLYPSASQAIADIRSKGSRNGPSPSVQTLLTQAEGLLDTIHQQYQSGNYPAVLASAHRLDTTLTEAYARTQRSRTGEFRGLWNHSGTGFSPGHWDETCQSLARGGMTAILPHVQRPWCAHYPSKLIPASDILSRYGDQLGDCLAAAHRHGLETHAWVILWSLDGAPDSLIATQHRNGHLQVSASGSTVSWLCPSDPVNRAFELAAIRDMVTRYPKLDGVQLDYIRYKSMDTCYCSRCRTRFTKDTGIQISHWPLEVRSGSKGSAYRQWRRNQITRFVADVRKEIKRINPTIKLSASVYPGYPGCRDSIGQDWMEWVKQGLVDFVCPMNYTADTSKFTEWYRKQTAIPAVHGRLYAGIGVTSMECRLGAVETMNQINALRREGAAGFTLFEANPTLENDILPYLSMGTTAKD